MRVLILGLGVQGRKRLAIAGDEAVAVVDPYNKEADYKAVEDVPLGHYDAALVCTPDTAKIQILQYLLSNKKHVLVEKPLLGSSVAELEDLAQLARVSKTTCYTAYNHRFEPHFVRMKKVLEEEVLGRVYTVRLFYGNGTARLVRNSVWRDQKSGVLTDLGSHLLDTFLFWFGQPEVSFRMVSSYCFENRAPDHCVFASHGALNLEAEMTLLSWRNHFTADVLAEKGSAHISSLCKWGPSSFILRDRKLPSGRPDEDIDTLEQADPTWQAEYDHFKSICETGASNIENDIWIQGELDMLSRQIVECEG